MLLPVFVWADEIHCCLPRPAVGDVVEWRLQFKDRLGHGEHGRPGPTRLAVVGRRVERENYAGEYAVRLDGDGICLYWDGGGSRVGPLDVSGYIEEDSHGYVPESLPSTHAVVRGIEVEVRDVVPVLAGLPPWKWATTLPRYRSVAQSPQWFRNSQPVDDTMETGIVVTLEIGRT